MSRLIDPHEQHARRPTPTALSHQRQTLDARAHAGDRRAAEIGPIRVQLTGCPLSHGEVEILRLIAGGLTNDQVAKVRGCAEQTIKNHVSGVLRKLGALNRTDAVREMDDTWPGWRTGERDAEATMPVRDVIRQLRTLADRLEWEAKRVGDVA